MATRVITVPLLELSTLAEICYHLTSHGAAFVVEQRGKDWQIQITGV
jgi:hypothetical protein